MVAVLIVGCGGGGSSGASSGEPAVDPTFRIAIREIDDLDDYVGEATVVGTQMSENLTHIDEQSGEVRPWLAEEIPTSSDGGLTWAITLRTGVTWHDGTPMDAASVVASFRRVLSNLATEQSGLMGGRNIADVTQTGARTLQVILKRPDPIFPRLMSIFKVQKAVDDPAKPVGTGPYKFVSWSRGQSVELTRNDSYWGQKPQVKDVQFKIIPDAGARLSALLAGEVDFVTNLQPEDGRRVPNFIDAPSVKHPFLVLDQSSGPTADQRVRQALNYATDKEAIKEQLLGGFGDVESCQALGATDVGFNDTLKAYPFDPDRARSMIKEAGFEGATIDVLGIQGRWLKDREIIEAVAQMWRDVGLQVEINYPSAFDRWLAAAQNRSDRPGAYYTSGNLYERDAAGLDSYLEMGSPVSSVFDEGLSTQFLEASRVSDPAQRQQALATSMATVCEQAPFVFAVSPHDLYGATEAVSVVPPKYGETYLRVQDVKMTATS